MFSSALIVGCCYLAITQVVHGAIQTESGYSIYTTLGPNSDTVTVLHDFDENMSVYKDISVGRCFIHTLNTRIANSFNLNIKYLPSPNQRWRGPAYAILTPDIASLDDVEMVAGDRIATLCRGFPAYMVRAQYLQQVPCRFCLFKPLRIVINNVVASTTDDDSTAPGTSLKEDTSRQAQPTTSNPTVEIGNTNPNLMPTPSSPSLGADFARRSFRKVLLRLVDQLLSRDDPKDTRQPRTKRWAWASSVTINRNGIQRCNQATRNGTVHCETGDTGSSSSSSSSSASSSSSTDEGFEDNAGEAENYDRQDEGQGSPRGGVWARIKSWLN